MAETPWSVKGVDRKAREAAKRAAHAKGLTLGAWLSDAILQGWSTRADDAGRTPAARAEVEPSDRPSSRSGGLETRIDALERKQIALARDTLSAMIVLRAELREAKASAETLETCRALGDAAHALENAASRSARPAEGAHQALREAIARAEARLDALEGEVETVRERAGPPALFQPPPRRKDVGAVVFAATLILGGVFLSALAAVALAGRA